MEDIIADALMHGSENQEMYLDRATCNLVARTLITCHCGDVLDQHTIHVVERRDTGRDVAGYCPTCAPNMVTRWPADKYRVITWPRDDS